MSESDAPKGCLGFLFKVFGVNQKLEAFIVVEKLEADLYPTGGGGMNPPI